jgi:hypothetical protein
MPLNSLGQAYATLLFKLLAKRHPQVLRTKKKLNVGQGYATLFFKLLAKRHQQVLRTKKGTMSTCIPSHYAGGTYGMGQVRNTTVLITPRNSNNSSPSLIDLFSLEVEGENLACSAGERKTSVADPDPLVRETDPDLDPSRIKQK